MSKDADASRPDTLPSLAPLASISCFITTEANLDTSAARPDLDHPPPKGRLHDKSSVDERCINRRRTVSQTSSDMACGTPPVPVPAGVVSSQSVASGLSSLDTSPSSSASGCSPKPYTFPDDPHVSMAGSSLHQLVMPSLTVPRRRSFTDVGNSLGHLKLLVSGPAGIGKTSLIRSLGQNCQHIVYLDPVVSDSTDRITEIYGSTRLHPWWRAETEETSFRANKRRKFLPDELLDNNICFADCPSTSGRLATGYVESQLLPLCQKPIGDTDLSHLLSGGAVSVVHAVLYMLPSTGPGPDDIMLMRALQHMTNVIPLLARADELTGDAAALSKRRLAGLLTRENLELFSFAGVGTTRPDPSIYAVSCTAFLERSEHDMHMSHMSFEHIHPPTDLADLVDHIFSLDGSSWLRHSAAIKCVNWRRRQLKWASQTALTLRKLPYSDTMTYVTLPDVRSSQWGPIGLSSWGESLRRSLTAERVLRSPSALPSGVEGIGLAMATTRRPRNSSHRSRDAEQISSVRQDPLGLLSLTRQINQGGRISLELLASLGGLGLAAWLVQPELARHWGICFSTS